MPAVLAPPAAADIAADWYRQQTGLAASAARLAARWWRTMDPADMDGYFRARARLLVGTVTTVQQLAAEGADSYVTRALAALGTDPDPAGSLDPGAFAGHAADGRALESLLYQPVVGTKTLIGQGVPVVDAWERGLRELLRITNSEIADAGRAAVGVRIASDRACTGYVRVCSATACPRCAILAGRVYAFNAGFRRHRRCHCIHMPSPRGRRSTVPGPRELFDRLGREQQDRVWGEANAAAIRAGADPAKLVNASRGTYTADVFGRQLLATHEGRKQAERYLRKYNRAIPWGAGPRLTPEAIYKIAENRADLIHMLRRYGYLTG
ncbi:hypothetical protein ACN20G_28235 (plasmid) [Streptomyces sp. BI20]|uniref:VG15 protein n=1 Tax=Streptomyces sp. BI20 TaxID=3403460 RepID=UPI003C74F921